MRWNSQTLIADPRAVVDAQRLAPAPRSKPLPRKRPRLDNESAVALLRQLGMGEYVPLVRASGLKDDDIPRLTDRALRDCCGMANRQDRQVFLERLRALRKTLPERRHRKRHRAVTADHPAPFEEAAAPAEAAAVDGKAAVR